MKSTLPAFVLAYHGCDALVAKSLLLGETSLRESQNDWDWLAGGAYFFENDPDRALNFAREVSKAPHAHDLHDVSEPEVVGAVIAPGDCLNLLDPSSHPQLIAAHQLLEQAFASAERPMPTNQRGPDKVMRNLDCAVIRKLHQEHERQHPDAPFQTVRAAFFEGDPLYAGAGFARLLLGVGFAAMRHVQIAVRDPDCILGYFRPLSLKRAAAGSGATEASSDPAAAP